MIIYNVAKKVLDAINISSAQHRWPDLWYYNYYFVQLGEAFTIKGNKYTDTHTTRFHIAIMYIGDFKNGEHF